MGLDQAIRRRLCVLALVASACAAGIAGAADTPFVRFAACGTCTAEGVEALIIKQTNIADLVGLRLDVRFLNPPPMGAGIASESLDVEWIGGQPTVAQLANNIPIKIVAYQYDFELRLEALPPVKSAADLQGKKIGVPFGTTAYKFASDITTRHKLPMTSLVNVAPTDLGTALAGGQVAAVVIWDPIWGVIEKTYKATPLEKEFHTGFTCMREKFLEQNRDAAVRFLAAQILAVAFRANNHEEAAKRYEAAFGVPVEVVHAAQAIDRSRDWNSLDRVDLAVQAKDFQDLAETQAFLVREKLIPRESDLKAAVDTSLLKEAQRLLHSKNITLAQVRYVSNAK